MILSSWHKAFLKLQDLHCGKINHFILEFAASLVAQRDRKEPACDIGDPGLVPGLGRSSGEGKSNPLQYSCLENPHGQRSLVGYSPWGCKESDMTD